MRRIFGKPLLGESCSARVDDPSGFFHLYSIAHDDVDYFMETFRIVRRNDEQKYGDYCSGLLILEIYDHMQESIASGRPYQTILDPLRGEPSFAHFPANSGELR